MILISNIDQLKGANSSVVHNMKFESIASFVRDTAFNELHKAIGRDTYTILVAGGGDLIGHAASLARTAEANLAIAGYVSSGSVKLGEMGTMVFQDEKYKIASDKKIAALVNDSRMAGYRALDSLLEYMEREPRTFTKYFDSPERRSNLNGFVHSTLIFNEAQYIDNNPVLFRSLKSFIRNAERQYIEPLLGNEFTTGFKSRMLAQQLTEDDLTLHRYIADVVAPAAIAEAIPYQAVKMDANGIFVNSVGLSAGAENVERQTSADTRRLVMAMTAMEEQSETSLARLREYIYNNSTKLPGVRPVTLDTRSTLNDDDRGFYFV
ncbi:DUF6712 family protein [Mucilaginibacter sp. CSA2-8R]|uniref:DUF6712 family protein n=2 Tax=Mucilaginibacter sp. CSA2-8R TaxID=3141542 RepID=UPI00315E02F5